MADSVAPSPAMHLADRVSDARVGDWQVLTVPTPVESVVSFQGSFSTYPRCEGGEGVLQDLVVALLDKGTRKRDRFQIAEIMDDSGAHLSIVSDTLRIRFSGKALAADVPRILDVLGEQLREPLFDPAEFEKTRAYVGASIRRELESTSAQSAAALSRLLYLSKHPNHLMAPADALAHLDALKVEDVEAFHARRFAAREAIVVFAGDVGGLPVARLVEQTLGTLAPAPAVDPPVIDGVLSVPGWDHVVLPDKSNSDVRLGHPLTVLRQDDDYLPLYVANYILGGNFSARLMAEIRDRMGLTYGIWSSLSGITTLHSGHWVVGVTLSRENLRSGIEATRREMDRFVEHGVQADELSEKQTTITGSFKVGLATTGGLAASLLYNAERGFEVGYLDQFPELIEGMEVDRVNAAIRTHLNTSQLSVAVAGPEEAAK